MRPGRCSPTRENDLESVVLPTSTGRCGQAQGPGERESGASRSERARPDRNMESILNAVIPFIAGLACGIPVGAALVIVVSAAMLSSKRSRQEEQAQSAKTEAEIQDD